MAGYRIWLCPATPNSCALAFSQFKLRICIPWYTVYPISGQTHLGGFWDVFDWNLLWLLTTCSERNYFSCSVNTILYYIYIYDFILISIDGSIYPLVLYVIFWIATLFERSAVQHQGFTCHGLGLNGSTTPFWRNFKDASIRKFNIGGLWWKIHHF